jgi:hypothetical protein
MNLGRSKKALQFYRKTLMSLGYRPVEWRKPTSSVPKRAALNHILWMLYRAGNFFLEGPINRWLGFAQGVMWALGVYNINEINDHSDPQPPCCNSCRYNVKKYCVRLDVLVSKFHLSDECPPDICPLKLERK